MSLTAMDTAVLWSHDWDPELPCEWEHEVTKCSGTATHIASSCVPALMVCESAAQRIEFGISTKARCQVCRRLAGDCFTLTSL